MIWTGDQCLAITGQTIIDETASRARAELETQTSHLIEAILWTNQVDLADFGASHPNVGLSDASLSDQSVAPSFGTIYTPNAWDAVPPVSGFKTMVEALSDALGGARGMIHVEKRVVPLLAFYGLTVQNGQRLVTTLGDHIVVPGTGYTGSDPAGGASSDEYSWIYGTSMVEVLLGPIDIITPNASEVLNRSTNEIEIRAERMALAHWDRQAHIGLSICLEDPAGDCSDAGS
jgi:hypothetical protein